MSVQSGAPSRASSPKKNTSRKATGPNKGRKAAKSFKVDGTPKKRWSSAERADRGHAKRKSGGAPNRAERRRQQFGDPAKSPQARNDRDYGRDSGSSTSAPRQERRSDDRRSDDRRSDDRPSYAKSGGDERRSSYVKSDDRRPSYARSHDDRRTDDRRTDDRRTDDRRDDRRSNDRGGYSRTGDDRRPSYARSNDARRSDDRRSDDRRSDDRGGYARSNDDRPRYDRTRQETSRQTRSERPRHEYGDDRGTRDVRSNSFREDRRDDRRSDRSNGFRDDRSGGYRDNRSGGFRDDRRSNSRDFDRPSRGFSADSGESDADNMSWTATELESVDTGSVTDEHGFARLGLPKPLVAALLSQGITDPFPIQAATIPDALTGRDVLGRGQTGSGKTLGFSLPMLTKLGGPDRSSRTPRGIVLVPTRELAMQVADVVAPLAKTLDLTVTLIAGGMAYGPQIKAFDRGVDIVIATPGRLIDLMEQGVVDLTQVQVAVLDEADHMADLGFMPAVTTIMDQMPADGQRLLFSATLDRAVDRLVKKYLSDPVTHEVDSGQATVTTMDHHVMHILPHDKNALTAEIAGRPGRTLIFVRTQRGADRVAEQLRAAGVMAGALHGGLTQGARTRILAAFKDGSVPVLVATDVAARGIHVDDIGLVLQVDPPAGPKDYLHRAGRTARAGGTGVVVTLALPHQRKEMYRLTSQAGVKSAPLEARPGDEALAEATGSRRPTGDAVSEAEFQRLIAPPARGGGRPRGRKDFGPRGGGYRGGKGGRGQGGRR